MKKALTEYLATRSTATPVEALFPSQKGDRPIRRRLCLGLRSVLPYEHIPASRSHQFMVCLALNLLPLSLGPQCLET